MTDLLMLGIVPGTDIQISFAGWLACTASLSVLLLSYMIYKKRLVTILLVSIVVYYSTRHPKLVPSA
jgi:hypothetical protein